MAKKYVIRNGVKIPADKAYEAAKLRVQGYTHAQIAKELNLTEYEVYCILNFKGD